MKERATLSIGTPHEAEGHARRAYERRKPGGGKVPRRAKVLRRQKERRELLAQGGKPREARGANSERLERHMT